MKLNYFLPLVISLIFLTSCGKSGSQLVLSGTIEASQTDVNSEASGKVKAIIADEGAEVLEGDAIIVLDSSAEELRVSLAEKSLETARLKLEELQAGTRAEQLTQAEAAMNEAKARLEGVAAGNRPEVIAQAEAQARIQKAKLDELLRGADAEKIEQAQSAYNQAQSTLSTAEENLSIAEASYNNVKTLYESGALSKAQFDEATVEHNNALLQKQTASEQLEIQRAALELIKKGAGAEAVSAQRAAYEQAEANLTLLRNGSTADAVAAAEAQLEQAEANYQMLKNGNTEYVVEAAEVAVSQQEINLELERLNLEKYEIKAPAGGTVLYNNVEIGELVNASQIVSTIQATDDFFIKIYVPQKHIGRISLNQRAAITTTALPDVTISGTVVFKSPKAEYTPKNIETNEAKEENTVFAVKLAITDNIDKLSAGMTASVYFD